MIKDRILRFLFIPILGMAIPYLSEVISYSEYSTRMIIAISTYFIFMSWCIWASSAWLHHKIRKWFPLNQNTFIKISTISLTNALFGGAIAGILTLVYYRFSGETFFWTYYFLTIVLSVLAVVVFTLFYEILYLTKERLIDSKVVYQLNRERSRAEMSNLKNELEPHFIFNSLNTLSHLILHDASTAHAFNSKLASVYKYFLINKERDVISLEREFEFICNYFFLLQIRYDDQLKYSFDIGKADKAATMIVPFALQIAVENAIKHNEFSSGDPLQITIKLEEDKLLVRNNRKQKSDSENSTGIGLKNLQARYRLVSSKNITTSISEHEYELQLPLIHKNTQL